MLPAPVSSRARGTYASPLTGKHRHYGNNSSSSSSTFGAWADQQLPPHWSSALNTLAQRSRATNLAVCLLLLAASVSLLVNIRLYFGDQVFRPPRPGDSRISTWLAKSIPSFQTSLDHLVVVPGHAIWNGQDLDRPAADDQWVLQDVQKGGTVKTLIKHITKGVELAAQDPNSLLVFSGSMTRAGTQKTEAQSYLEFADDFELFPQYNPGTPMPFPRATTELFALDSYQNLIYSMARFKEVTGRYPSKITVVGFGMKRRRFEDIHRAAVRFPSSAFAYVGIDDEDETGKGYTGELQYGLQPFQHDTYGCHGELLEKRRSRNIYNRYPPYMVSAPEMAGLLDYCPSDSTKVYRGSLPWS